MNNEFRESLIKAIIKQDEKYHNARHVFHVFDDGNAALCIILGELCGLINALGMLDNKEYCTYDVYEMNGKDHK